EKRVTRQADARMSGGDGGAGRVELDVLGVGKGEAVLKRDRLLVDRELDLGRGADDRFDRARFRVVDGRDVEFRSDGATDAGLPEARLQLYRGAHLQVVLRIEAASVEVFGRKRVGGQDERETGLRENAVDLGAAAAANPVH